MRENARRKWKRVFNEYSKKGNKREDNEDIRKYEYEQKELSKYYDFSFSIQLFGRQQ